MKTLDLNKYGVQEMNVEEMRENEGGGWSDWVTAAQLAYSAVKTWVNAQAPVLNKLGTDAQIAAMQYN